MPSGADVRRFLCTAAAVAVATVTLPVLSAQPQPTPAIGERPGPAEIARAIAAVKADPNLASDRTIKVLRWNESPPARTSGLPSWVRALLTWMRGLVSWLNDSTRVLWWLAAATLAGVLVVYLIRIIRARSPSSVFGETFVAPTHVQDLDIRPETLPDDVGAAALAMWDRGECRAALALLYRGLLSRLAHVHHVPIRDSSTEGDCLALSAGHLPAARHDYAFRLVKVWQRAVYGGEQVPTGAVHVLCVEFGPSLDYASRPGLAAPVEHA